MQVRLNSATVLTTILLVGILSLVSGCYSSGPNLSPVSGTVKAKGKLVKEGEVMFYPTGGGRPSVGIIDADGRYELTSKKKGDGVAPGSYKVTITALITEKNDAPEPSSVDEETEEFMAERRVIWLIPNKFSELSTTTLTAEVEDGKANEINFDSTDF